MNRIRVLFSLTLLLAAASLASAGSFGPRACTTADGAVVAADMSACPTGGPDCCTSCCPLPCAPGETDAASAMLAVAR